MTNAEVNITVDRIHEHIRSQNSQFRLERFVNITTVSITSNSLTLSSKVRPFSAMSLYSWPLDKKGKAWIEKNCKSISNRRAVVRRAKKITTSK